jgi:hypothetical protein
MQVKPERFGIIITRSLLMFAEQRKGTSTNFETLAEMHLFPDNFQYRFTLAALFTSYGWLATKGLHVRLH